jgi:2-polyprenyl-3-methyl-5-hydroxy-6-metoxy-1,4-benzoquinol methylase
MGIRDVLESPVLYQSFQVAGGFFGARVRTISKYLKVRPGSRVIDIGCGPGFIVDHLPAGIDYFGFDIDARYIAYAQRHFADKGTFQCRPFDDDAAAALGLSDIVMMNGVIHHLDDNTAIALLKTIHNALNPNGILFTLDNCFHEGQSKIASFLARNDRGRFVRSDAAYTALLQSVFKDVEIHVRDDLSWVPYSFVIGLSRTGLA